MVDEYIFGALVTMIITDESISLHCLEIDFPFDNRNKNRILRITEQKASCVTFNFF